MSIQITPEMQQAVSIIENTTSPVYITGKAGTGKTTLLKYIMSRGSKKFIIVSPTGVAAINAGGVTIHSMFNMPFGPLDDCAADNSYFNKEKKELFNNIDGIIIDEISMVRPDMMDFIDTKLRGYRRSKEAFGGLQLVMFGDLFQLPPVVTDVDKEILSQWYKGYNFFNANVFKEISFSVVELTHVFRQSDPHFVDLLNNIREYKMSNSDIDWLSEVRNKSISDTYDNSYIHICTHKWDVEKINNKMLGEHTHEFAANIQGTFSEKAAPCDLSLRLREGARVMVLVNNTVPRYCNGSLGVVQSIGDKVSVLLDDGQLVEFERHKWTNNEYKLVDGKVETIEKGSCEQYPLTLAWAITIHKSQGLTFDKVAIHTKGVFVPGQIYVALSRCRSFEGLVTDTFLSRKHILSDENILRFHDNFKNNNYTYINQ